MYINTHSYFSLRYGTLSLENIISLANINGIKALALTDINNSSGILDFVKQCQKKNIKPIAGIEFRNKDELVFIGVARNNEGFRELNSFLSEHTIQKKKISYLADCFNNCYIIFPLGKKKIDELNYNEFIGIKPTEIRKIFDKEFHQNQSKFVALNPVTFADKQGYDLHKHLIAIDHNVLLSQLEPQYLASSDEIMLPIDKLMKLYSNFPQIVKNTEQLIADCFIEFDYTTNKNKLLFTENAYKDKNLLKKITFDGIAQRYGENNQEAIKRAKKELEIINNLGFCSYFLIGWDIIRYSLAQGIYHVGRGSGANSVVAYCLKITDVDPIELDLYFERFINPKRSSPPDFDIDYSWKDREAVQKYIFLRYGKEHTALLGAMSTFQVKSALRELGKVYGLPKNELDTFINNPEANLNTITRRILYLGNLMNGFPNIRSIHAGGIVISDKPITYYTALDMPPKGFQTTQWDMYTAESIGFEKLDILSQRGIGHIHDSVELIKENKGIEINIHEIEKFKKDTKIKELMRRGETNGCFYVESPAMRGLLQKLKCDNYLTLVAASSIIRPGVAKSGMMKEYIRRYNNPNDFTYLHPIMEEQLKETFGVMVYQEDVLKICHYFAGLDLADADVLRRIMSGKSRYENEFQLIVNKFFANCEKIGYPNELTKEVWRQISSFAGYSFSKAHSASYAVESFQSLYLKAYYPIEFMVAVINNFGGFYSTWVYFNEARRWGANIKMPCVNRSTNKTTLIGKNIYIGFIHIANLEKEIVTEFLNERKQNGNYSSLQNFVKRVNITKEQLIILVRCDAFKFTGQSKIQSLWELHILLGKSKPKVKSARLFDVPDKNFEIPDLKQTQIEDAYDEIELIGFPVTLTYFDLLKTNFRGEIYAKHLTTYVGHTIRMIGLLVHLKYVRTISKKTMYFGTFIDAKGEFFDTVHFPNSLKKYPFKGQGVYLLMGKVVDEYGFPSIEIEKSAKLPFINDPRYLDK